MNDSGEVKLMKGNEALAIAAIRYGCDGYFGYPITPQSEVLETLEAEMPWETTGMVVLQAESEPASINMVYAGAACGKAVFTSSSSPGVSLMQEGFSFIAAGNLPALVVNVQRGGPGLGSIQPSQADYFQATKGGGHGDYHFIVLSPASVQEMADFVALGWDLAFKYRNPALILADGFVGQMMEKVVIPPQRPRRTDAEILEQCPWAIQGRSGRAKNSIISTLELDSALLEINNQKLQEKYDLIRKNEQRAELINTDDADYIIVAIGSTARVSRKAIELATEQGIKVGLVRPITLWPFPEDAVKQATANCKGVLVVEMNSGQMIEDVKLSAQRTDIPILHFGRMGGMNSTPEDVLHALKDLLVNKQ